MPEILKRHQTFFQSGALVLIGLIAFWQSVAFDFVNWDDVTYVTHNELITSWSPSNLWGVATETVTRNYGPLTIFSFLIDHTLWGKNPCGYHATNVLLHLANGVLVFLLLKQLTGNRFVAWLAAALFLIHPVQIESVVWISSRKGLLCSLFMLWASIIRLRPEVTPKQDAWYIGLLIAALLSKALAIVFPPIVLLYDVLIRRDKTAPAIARQVIPGLLSLLLLFYTASVQNSVLGGVRGHMDFSLLHIMAIDVTILWQYIGMLCCPTDLCVMYDPPTSGIGMAVVIGSIAWMAVGYAFWRVRRTQPLWILGAVSFFLLLFPVLNFFRITTLMNDRYLYLPSIIVFTMAAGAVHRVIRFAEAESNGLVQLIGNSLRGMVVVGILAACLNLTLNHLPVWQNSQTLWTHAIAQYPKLPVLRIQMALAVHARGQEREAIRQLRLALLECQPDDQDRERMRGMISDWESQIAERRKVATGPKRQHDGVN
ncbi:MAG: hypothetical protein KDB01_09745 [Planctomycetaceae bacterium]|nr:hypothetical protein [Planctomycetaceae bacterium]